MNITKSHIILLFFIYLSCNNDTEIQKENISIINFNGNITSVTESKSIINSDSFKEDAQIGIFGWGHTDGSTTNQSLRKDLNNAQYIKVAGSNEFTSDLHAHYPINPDTLLNFYAYYPYIAAASPSNIPFDLKKQDDIMWAIPVTDKDKTTADTPINLSFNHILSAITLKFKKADDIKEDMILQSISLENYPSTVQLNVQTGKLNAAPSTSPYTIISGQNTTMTSTEITIVTNYLLYPIEKPVFIVRMSDKDYRIESTKAFEGGKKQTYSFTIQAKDITISGSINPWVEGEASNETVYF